MSLKSFSVIEKFLEIPVPKYIRVSVKVKEKSGQCRSCTRSFISVRIISTLTNMDFVLVVSIHMSLQKNDAPVKVLGYFPCINYRLGPFQ